MITPPEIPGRPARKRPYLIGCGIALLVAMVIVAVVSIMSGGSGSGGGFFSGGQRIGVVPIEGVIMKSRDIVEKLDDFRKNEDIRAVVIRVDSPGGSVGPSQEIYEAVRRLDKKKPVVVSMGAVAASGGYYVALGGRKIIANPGTITGSIGVIMQYVNLEGVLDWAKIRPEVIKSGEFKDIGSPYRPLKKEEREILQALIDDVHKQFIGVVAERRKMDEAKAISLATGVIFSGKQAKEAGLVDEVGDMQAAIDAAAKLANISGEPKLVYPPKRPSRFWEFFSDPEGAIENLSGFSNVRILYLWRI